MFWIKYFRLYCNRDSNPNQIMQNKYPIYCYDKNISLKLNGTMWLIILFLLKSYFIALLSVVNMTERMQLIDMFYSDRLMLSLGALAGIPAVLIIYAWIKRTPNAPPLIRNIWARGRTLLIISAILHACIIFVPLWLGTSHKIMNTGWIQIILSLIIATIVYKSPYIKDCFSDFPEK